MDMPLGHHRSTVRPRAGCPRWHHHVQAYNLTASPRSMRAQAVTQHIVVLDFDGVVVDSEGEVSHSALNAARQRWPDIMQRLSKDDTEMLMQGMRRARPVLVRGYESMVMVRMLAEDGSSRQIHRMLQDWANVLPQQLKAWGEKEDELAPFFEKLRNTWMTSHSDEWLSRQRPYPGVMEVLNTCPFPLYLATSKAGHRVSKLLHELGYPMAADDPRLFASLLPPESAKAAALHTITLRHTSSTDEQHSRQLGPAAAHASIASAGTTSAAHAVQSAVQTETASKQVIHSVHGGEITAVSEVQQSGLPIVHFVDDRLDTLAAVASEPHLAHVQLYLASWGYCTEAEREEAANTPRVRVIDLPEFYTLLKHGHLATSENPQQN